MQNIRTTASQTSWRNLYLYRFRWTLDLSPWNCFIRLCSWITTIKLLGCVNIDCIIRSIAEHISIAYMMLWKASTKNYYPCLPWRCMDGFPIHEPYICNDFEFNVSHKSKGKESAVNHIPCTMSIIRPGLRTAWQNSMSPSDPSVNDGQYTGMLFWSKLQWVSIVWPQQSSSWK